MKNTLKLGSALVALAVALACGNAAAESTYGYNSAGTGTVTATARVNLSVTVPKLILLRVGSAAAVVDTLSWTVDASIPATPTIPSVTGNNVGVNWSGAAPTLTGSASPAALTVYAWTNATAGTINCALGAWSAVGGPTNANFTVAVTGTLPHPGANLGACASTSFPSNTVATGTWTYSLGGTPGSWAAGAYTNVITYTATGI
jgi:hypothetical protein